MDTSPLARALQELEDLTGRRYGAAWLQLGAAEGVVSSGLCIVYGREDVTDEMVVDLERAINHWEASQA